MKIKTDKIKQKLRKLPAALAWHPFLAFCVFLLISLIIGGLFFAKYVVFLKESEDSFTKNLRFQEKVYEEVLDQWETREHVFEEADIKKYSNPFRGWLEEVPTSTEESTSTSTEEATSTEESNPPEIQELLEADCLYVFYMLKGELLPFASERSIMWESFGLGTEEEYRGLKYQNELLLEELKKDLTK